MTGKANLFSHLELKKGGKIVFGDNAKGKIVGIGQVGWHLDVAWHRRLSHASIELIEDLSKGDHVIILPKVKFQKDKVCEAS